MPSAHGSSAPTNMITAPIANPSRTGLRRNARSLWAVVRLSSQRSRSETGFWPGRSRAGHEPVMCRPAARRPAPDRRGRRP